MIIVHHLNDSRSQRVLWLLEELGSRCEEGDCQQTLFQNAQSYQDALLLALMQVGRHLGVDAHELHKAMEHMAGAITAMQFQDMASQLVDHTSRRLRNCADRIARDTMGDDEDGEAVVEEAPMRPNPVTQDEMDAGTVELF